MSQDLEQLLGVNLATIIAEKMVAVAKEYRLELAYVDPRLIVEATQIGDRVLDRIIRDMLSDALFAAKKAGERRVRLDIDKDEVMVLSSADEESAAQRRFINEEDMRRALKRRVKGQDHIIDDVVKLIAQRWNTGPCQCPIANLLFVGLPGTGKTDLARAVAEYLYDENEKNLLHFACVEFNRPEGVFRLLGVPQGYIGWEQGGQLTRPVLNNPKRLILFELVNEFSNEAVDLILQRMMGEGRLTEQSSDKVADFAQSIIVLTTNAEADAIGKLQEWITDYDELTNVVKSYLVAAKVLRPAIANPINRVYVLKPIEGVALAECVALKTEELAKGYELKLTYIDPRAIVEIAEKHRRAWGRTYVGVLIRDIDETLGDVLFAAKKAGAKRVRLEVDEDGAMSISPAE